MYIYEAIGGLVGGIAGTYLCLQYLNSFQTAFGLALLNIFSAILLLVFVSSKPKLDQFQEYKAAFYKSRFTLKIAVVALLIICVLLFPLGGIDYLHSHSIKAQRRHYNVLDYRNSIYGNVTVLQRLKQLNIMSNGVPVSTIPTPNIAFIEEFVHLALLSHPNPQKVLLVGGGIGGVLKEMLKHTVHHTQTAGKLYAADLIGSWFGALFVTIAFIPLFGIMNTCLLVLFVNICSLLLFVFSKR